MFIVFHCEAGRSVAAGASHCRDRGPAIATMIARMLLPL
jgi:hypothetical protein